MFLPYPDHPKFILMSGGTIMFPETYDIAFTSSAAGYGIKSYLFDFDTGDFIIRDGKPV